MGQNQLLKDLREGKKLTFRQQLLLIVQLSIPGILAQISEIIMEYIDASMVGSLGADASASIGLIASTTWLMGGIGNAVGTGFSVQIAQYVGAGNEKKARDIFRQGIVSVLCMGALIGLVGALIHAGLPVWLGGDAAIVGHSADYFLVFSLTMPVMTLLNLVSGALQCTGNMTAQSLLLVMTCILDVVFNSFMIFPEHSVAGIPLPGAGLGVAGAALGTTLAEVTALIAGILYIQWRSRIPRHRGENRVADCVRFLGTVRGADYLHRHRRASRHTRDRGQFAGGHGGEPLLYAGLRHRFCGDDTDRTEHRCGKT